MLLAIDTATKSMGVAVHDGGSILAEVVWTGKGYHTADLAPEIGLILKRIDSSVSHLTAVAVVTGPGSFTGLRIGLALAKGMALSHKLDLVGIPTHEVLAYGQPPRDEEMIAVIRAGRSRLSTVRYKWQGNGWRPLGNPVNQSWEELFESLVDTVYLCGELDAEDRQRLAEDQRFLLASPALCVRRPGMLADLGWQKLRSGELSHPAQLVPIYTRSVSGL
ncbi:MAG: tRNA (adenosine(37)-N6)-threonylcarbamoyltransferase complex dimerization subunit type 1 TsaB [Anaerolineales bacterium]|nr:tRNA (adenosine(37)-N6)-threonylcarbamoyltransferase complex dimerization subunit type 1 TsaB [Anaerolineales bacterium]